MVRKPHSRRHNISTLTPNPDIPLEIRAHIHTLYEKAKPAILDQNQTLEGLTQTTTALFTEIWKSAPALNLDGIRGARKALRWYPPCYRKPAAIPNSLTGALMRIVFSRPHGPL
jgi:hypothetical protein